MLECDLNYSRIMCVAKCWIKKDYTNAHTHTHTNTVYFVLLSMSSLLLSLTLPPISAKPLTHTSLSEPKQSGIVNGLMKVGGLFAKESSLQLLVLSDEKIQELYRLHAGG